MHAQASVGAGIWLHPAGVESVVCLKFAPIWHGGSLEVPTCGFFCEPCLNYSAVFRCVAMAVGPVFVIFLKNTECSKRSWFALRSDCYGHDQKRPAALHDVGCLIPDGYLDLYVGRIHSAGSRQIEGRVASRPTSTPGRGRTRHGAPACTCHGENEEYFHEKIKTARS